MTLSRELRGKVVWAIVAAVLSGLLTQGGNLISVGQRLQALEQQVTEVRGLLFDHINRGR